MKILFVPLAVVVLTISAAGQPPTKPATSAPAASAPADFEPLRFLVGRWKGTTDGQPGHGEGERTYEFTLGGKFLRGANHTVYPPQEKNPKGEVHEDMGLYSYDRRTKRLVLRQFHVEGFVNEYMQTPTTADGALVFETDRIENIPEGWRARETWKQPGPDEFTEKFELAAPGKDWEVYAESRWKRVK
jgi:hypothetical protein